MIRRNIEKIVEETAKHFPIVLVAGPRQIGKSTLLYNSLLKKGFSYISLDDSLELSLAKNDPRSFLNIHKAPLIIDEAQKAPSLFPELERIVNESRLKRGNLESNGLYILSGSQRKSLLSRSQESLSGRVGILDMTTLSLNEIKDREDTPFAVDLSKAASRANDYSLSEEEAFKYIARGFFPGLYADEGMSSQIFYSSYLTTFIERDLRDLILLNDETAFINFLRLLASNTGEELVYDNYAKVAGVSLNTVKSWVNVLSDSGIIYLVAPYNEESLVKRVAKRPKMYFFDTGLAAYLCGIDSPLTLQKSFLKGRFFETFVFNEIRKSFINEGIKQDLYYYRDSNQNEVDLILLRDGVLSCVEIKAGTNFNAGYSKSFSKLSATKYIKGGNAIVCMADKVSVLNDGTYLFPVSAI